MKMFAKALLAICLLVSPLMAGKGTTGTVHISPIYLSFGVQNVGSVSGSKTITVTNNTQLQISFTSVSAPGGFSAVSNTCTILLPTQSCTAEFVFAPAYAGNYVSEAYFYTTISPTSPFVAVLYGTAY